jgi:hypothetical protein
MASVDKYAGGYTGEGKKGRKGRLAFPVAVVCRAFSASPALICQMSCHTLTNAEKWCKIKLKFSLWLHLQKYTFIKRRQINNETIYSCTAIADCGMFPYSISLCCKR